MSATDQTVRAPFYAANNERVVGDNRRWELAYFLTREDAQAHVDAKGSGYVIETTQGQIWRATTPH